MNVVLYDGDCGFCNFWVQWILERDTKDQFQFASLQSDFGQSFLVKNNLPIAHFDTLYLLQEDRHFTKLKAVAEIGRILGGSYRFLILLKFLPDFLSNFIYDRVAANRQKLASANCLLPTIEERKKFIGNHI
ncbi:MAG: DCC1-like thiol-disulfide oxidoreductase family protein [Weeksellaceae bacterium]|nr:DCC1-like thiol-disulfide oxidoreductase family protein [Weeksellaceae bacterium]